MPSPLASAGIRRSYHPRRNPLHCCAVLIEIHGPLTSSLWLPLRPVPRRDSAVSVPHDWRHCFFDLLRPPPHTRFPAARPTPLSPLHPPTATPDHTAHPLR